MQTKQGTFFGNKGSREEMIERLIKPLTIDEITIYVGTREAAEKVKNLKGSFSLLVDISSDPVPENNPSDYLPLQLRDNSNQPLKVDDLLKWTAQMEQQRQEGKILICCNAGKSRSVALAVAYFLSKTENSLEEILNKIQVVHPEATITSFARQLIQFEDHINLQKAKPVNTTDINRLNGDLRDRVTAKLEAQAACFEKDKDEWLATITRYAISALTCTDAKSVLSYLQDNEEGEEKSIIEWIKSELPDCYKLLHTCYTLGLLTGVDEMFANNPELPDESARLNI